MGALVTDLPSPGSTDWSGLRVVVAGLGIAGFACADGRLQRGAQVTVVDGNDGPDQQNKAQILDVLGASVRLGDGHTLPDADLLVVSPGLRPSAPITTAALAAGMPPAERRELAWRLRERAEKEQEPAILEAVSFRFRGHSVIDADRYRDPEEVKKGRSQDPILMFAKQLLDAAVVDEGWLKETDARVKREVQAAIDFADKSPDPKFEDLFDYMYASPVPNTPGREEALQIARNVQGGR